MSLLKQIKYVVINTLTIPLLFYVALYLTDFFGAMVPIITYALQIFISYAVFYKCFKRSSGNGTNITAMWIRIFFASLVWTIAVFFEPTVIKSLGELTRPAGAYGEWLYFPMRILVFRISYGAIFLTITVLSSHLIYRYLLESEVD